MMFLCFPIIFIISISDTRSDRSFSVASSTSIMHTKHQCVSPTPPAAAASCPALGGNGMKLNVRPRRLSKPFPSFHGSGAKAQTGKCADPCQAANLGSTGSKVRTGMNTGL